jgi:hypothetical protein
MNKSLSISIYNQIRNAISGSTDQVYYDHLPSEELLSELTVVYSLNNTDNLLTFEDQEAGKTYQCEVQINDTTSDQFETYSVFIKRSLYDLVKVNQRVKHVKLLNEDVFYDDELFIWTEYLRFEVQYT